MASNQKPIPMWIQVYAGVLGVFSLGMGIWAFVAPSTFFAVGNMTLEGSGADLITYLFGARNLGVGVAFGVGMIFFRTRPVLTVLLSGRVIIDGFDTVAMLLATDFLEVTVAAQGLPMSVLIISIIVSMLAIFIVPMSVAIYQLQDTK